MHRTIYSAGLALALLGCGPQDTADAAAAPSAAPAASVSDVAAELGPAAEGGALPSNADLKMVDGDIVQYARSLCGFDQQAPYRPSRCDVFAQGDPAGTLIGYLAVRQSRDGVWLDSAITLGSRLAGGPRGCGISGKLSRSDRGGALTGEDIAGNYRARTGYAAWEKEPGNWLVVPDDGSDKSIDNPKASFGMWYIERSGDNLRLSQERWNYCYRDSGVTIDDVFRRVVTLRAR